MPAITAGDRVVQLSSEDAHHVSRVLRLAAGDSVRVFNGRGNEWRARVTTVGRGAVTLDLVAAVAAAPEPPVQVTLGIGVLKGDQMDGVVRDATVLGASRIVPLATTHVTVPPRAWRSGAATERWRRVAIAAAKQSGRAVVPDIAPVTPFGEALASPHGAVVMAVEPVHAATSATASAGPRPSSALVLVGPEGGWSGEELSASVARHARLMHVGPRTLRAELAPAVVLASLWTQWGWQ